MRNVSAAAFTLACALTVLSLSTAARSAKVDAQAPAPVPIDTSKIGPHVGQAVPPLEGVDQFGTRHTLSSIAGPRGTMLVFFRSADW